MFGDIKYHVEREVDGAWAGTSLIEFANGSSIRSLAKEHRSAAGSRHAVTIWDELWGYTSESRQAPWLDREGCTQA